MASDPKQDHVYILKSFAEFESVARRALHAGNVGLEFCFEFIRLLKVPLTEFIVCSPAFRFHIRPGKSRGHQNGI